MLQHTILGFLLVALASCATSAVEQRENLYHSLRQASALGEEIAMWRSGLPTPMPASVTQSVEAFSERAELLRDELEGEFDRSATGVDINSVLKALERIAQFSTDDFENASQSARRDLLDQLSSLAESASTAADRAKVDLG